MTPDIEASAEEHLAIVRRALPDEPGIYKYFDKSGTIIYVGKARSLKKRVNSYFTKGRSQDFKTRVLVDQIHSIQFVVTHNDMEALLLENNLIKEYQPKYNLMLKDGKTYPYICIKKERFSRVFSTRRKIRDGSLYFGPFASVSTLNTILRFIRDTYQLRSCNLVLSEKNIAAGKFRPCLEFHIGNCAAPCVGKQEEESYNTDIQQIKQILRGRYKQLLDQLKEEMETAVAALDFERAQYLKTRQEQVRKHKRRSTVVSETVGDVEVLTILGAQELAIVNHFKVLGGTIVQSHTFQTKLRNEESGNEVIEAVFAELLVENEGELCERILSNVNLSESEYATGYKWVVPERGDELKLLELSLQNCQAQLDEKLNISRLRSSEDPTERLLQQVMHDLRLTQLPRHIECFDNSNIQGYAPVSSCVVFKNGKPAKRDYRVYNVKTVVGIDDFASMKEVVFRRYRRQLDENQPLPDLVVIDGGKGQLSSAIEALTELGLEQRISIVSIAKRLEEIYYKDDPVPLYIDKKSPTLRLLQRIRNEAHTTAITYHRQRRGQKTLKTELTEIPGVGPATVKKLLTHFKSVKRIREANEIALAEIVGLAKAKVVRAWADTGCATDPETDATTE